MQKKPAHSIVSAIATLVLGVLACNFGVPRPAAPIQSPAAQLPEASLAPSEPATAAPATPSSMPSPTVTHVMTPSGSSPSGELIYDVVSQDTAPEKRAPYGDSYDINRLERPFLQDMTYVPDLDIASFTVASDSDWWYVSIELTGNNPNNAMGIDYGVELDTDHDGFGDYLVRAQSPYDAAWDTASVQIFQDTNHDTGGLSAEKSDAPMKTQTDGYDTQIFHGGVGDADPDLAWVRMNAGPPAAVQFAFKKAWSGSVFMLGVIADAGLKDPKKLDYVDRFTIAEAGSPVRSNSNYPLKALFAVDNVCRAPFGFKPSGSEPQLCPSTEPAPTKKPKACVPVICPPSSVGGCVPVVCP